MCFVSTFWLWWIMFLQLLFWSLKNFESESCSVVSDSFWPRGLYSPWNSPGQNTGVGSFPFSRGSSQPMDWTQASRIAGEFFTNWAVREAIFCEFYSKDNLAWVTSTFESGVKDRARLWISSWYWSVSSVHIQTVPSHIYRFHLYPYVQQTSL